MTVGNSPAPHRLPRPPLRRVLPAGAERGAS
ncbi:hypothetical protein Ae406Ps2_4817c [Pseudonocardia sp. Ae406_Ps2]|nr:hypothetical protein Ae331Ps2_1137 [Pseudonocardia sp. Ae331_Ps2]OLM04817.1 hypothetical protein Ae406Ps2_4817c [Pseudonocardia sp. Ae406_Ps2]OLM10358.1 hypothetical protein Ae505Ps2_0481 [Pseudonocardia sp. Ae505_Ps2]OLM26385.1 hypothetical protein Ae706Ps2_4818c [Pseudonocardia sp. Ae706_Ps2]